MVINLLFLRRLIKKYLYYRFIDLIINREKFFRDLKEDLNTLWGKYKYSHKKILIIALPKSGSTWIENFLYKINGYVARRIWGDEDKILEQKLQKGSFKNFSDFLFSYAKLHIDPTEENISILKESGIKKVLILYRDPRDVAVSRYFHLLKHPKKSWEPNFVDYLSMSKEEGITDSVKTTIKDTISWIDGWIEEAKKEKERYFVIKYEDILEDRDKIFLEISRFFELSKSENEVKDILVEIDKNMKKGFNLKSTAGNKSTFRKGGSGDWKNHFSEKDIESFKKVDGELKKFGYEW